MLELKNRVLKLKFNDEICEINYPTVMEIKKFSKSNVDGEDNLENTLAFLEGLGMSKKISKCLELSHLTQIIEHLTEQKKKLSVEDRLVFELINFYPQYKLDEILELPFNIYEKMVLAMKQIKSEKHLYSLDAALYPNMKNKSMVKHKRAFEKLAYPEKFEERILKTSDLELI